MKRTIGLLALLGFACTTFAAAQVGKPAPDFNATDTDGKTHKLSDYKGKIVVLEAYNPDCPYVKNHYKSGAMPELQKELAEKDVVWLLVNSVPKGNTDKAKQEQGSMNATACLNDSSATIAKAYGMRTTPHMFVIDKEGILTYQGAIDDKPAADGDPRKAKNYVREVVQKVSAGQKPEVTETKPYGCGVKY